MNALSGITRLRPTFIALNRLCGDFHNSCNIGMNFSTSSINFLKEIRRTEANGVITIEGVYVESPREGKLIQYKYKDDYVKDSVPTSNQAGGDGASPSGVDEELLKQHSCPLCKLGMPVRHTDVLILSQFVRADGGTLPRRITGLCKEQQKRVNYLVAMAHKAGLMPNLKPANSNFDPKRRWGWNRYNKYYDESIIDDFFNPRKRHIKKA